MKALLCQCSLLRGKDGRRDGVFRKWGALGLRGAFSSEPLIRRKSPPVVFVILVIFLIAAVCLFIGPPPPFHLDQVDSHGQRQHHNRQGHP